MTEPSITVAIPTYKNFGSTIKYTLKALTMQTYKDFKVLIVYKPYPGDNTLNIIDEFKDQLNIEVLIQSNGYFEEALNMIYNNTESDILVLTDDDSLPSSTWLEEHVKLHLKYPEVGIIGGEVIEKRNKEYYRKRLMHRVFGFYKPLLNVLENYESFFNDMGLWVYRYRPLNQGEIRKTLYVEGVNISIKKRVYKDFQLPCYTIRGRNNEFLLGLYGVLKGLHVIRYGGAYVKHLARESLSRTTDSFVLKNLLLEDSLIPYGVSQYYREINLHKLKFYKLYLQSLKKLLKLFKKRLGFYIDVAPVGLEIALKAIKENREPKWVRERLIQITKILRI